MAEVKGAGVAEPKGAGGAELARAGMTVGGAGMAGLACVGVVGLFARWEGAGDGRGLGAVLGEIPAASAGMTELQARV